MEKFEVRAVEEKMERQGRKGGRGAYMKGEGEKNGGKGWR